MEYKVGVQVFDDWQITREIGSGASGRVWELVKIDHDISTSSALKVIHVPQDPSLEKALYSDGMDEGSVTRFFQGVVNDLTEEIKIMIDMKGFPYIVNCEDYKVIKYPDEVKWDILIRMELLTPIQEYMKKNRLSEADVLKMSRELIQTLSLFEERGIIHRDIKPDNIFVDKYGNFKIGDFGIARVCDKASVDLSKKGTENYMAPEVFHGKDYDHTVDIYSLGLVLYKLLNNNRLPFYPQTGDYTDWDMQQALIDRLSGKKALPLPCAASPEFGKVIIRMCAHNPAERYQTAKEILTDLEHITGSVKGIVGLASDAGAATGGTGRSFDETRALFGGAMVFHEAEAARKTGKSMIGSSASSSGSQPGSGRTESGSQGGSGRTEKSGSGQAGSGRAEKSGGGQAGSGRTKSGSGSSQSEESRKNGRGQSAPAGSRNKKRARKRMLIQGLSAAAVLLAILLYFLTNTRYELSVTDGSGAGSYKGGEKVTVTAAEVPGSAFTGWEVSGKLSLSDEELASPTVSFKMPRHEIALKAVYTVNRHNAVVNNGSGTGEYPVGEEVMIEADAPAEGMKFSGWDVEDGSVMIEHADKPKTSFVMPDEDVELSAVYKTLQYSLQVENGDGSGSYDYGKAVRILAQEISGETFREWEVLEGELALSEEEKVTPELTVNMPSCDVIIRAVYSVNQHEVVVNGGSGSGTYEVGEKVTIQADPPAEGKAFAGWELEEGSVSLQNAQKEKTNFDMTDDGVVLSAVYKNLTYSLQVEDGQGSGTYEYGETVRITAQEISGKTFSGWTVTEGELALSEEEKAMPELSIHMPSCDVILCAEYKANQHKVTVNGGSGSGTYEVGEQVTLEAAPPAVGKEFAGWELEEGSVSIQNSQKEKATFTMPDGSLVINALYQDIDYELTVNDGNGSGSYHYGEQVQVSARDSDGGKPFSHWSVEKGTLAISDLTVKNITFTMPAEEVAMTAHYSVQKYTLKVEGGKGSGMYEAGGSVTIKADEKDKNGVPFAGWEVTEGSLKLEDAKKNELTFEMPSEKTTIKAVYEAQDAYSVVVFGGSGAGVYAEGETVTITAEETPGKKFNCWFINQSGGQTVQNDNATFSFSMPATDLIITAQYDLE